MNLNRALRDIKSLLEYPVWVVKGRQAPDNHLAKKIRVLKFAKKHNCTTFIETGTYYGQMVKFAANHFQLVMSVELLENLYKMNCDNFKNSRNIILFHGDSSVKLEFMLEIAEGKIIFWLDGHYSGKGTGLSKKISPIIEELNVICRHHVKDHCILIDDARLFTGRDGYPTMEEVITKIMSINNSYKVYIENDCIVSEIVKS